LKEKELYNDEYLTRLEDEARIQKIIGDKLNTCMFAYPIFLQHYLNRFWDIGSTVGAGRGSACAGLNHWLLGVTQLDPIKWELPYWRFLNEDRVELPDIDIDICPSKREEIFDYIREERGQLGCIQVCTYGTETTRSAISTACRGYRSKDFPDGIDNDISQYMTSLAPSERGFVWPVHDLVYGNEEKDRKPVKNFLAEVRKYPGLLEIIEKIEGLINHRGIHASGVNFYMNDPFDSACFMKATSGAIVTQFSLHDAEYCGDVKFDFLVTEIQDVIVQCLNMLQEYNEVEQDLTLRQLYDKYLHPDVLPIEDDKIWKTLSEAKVLKLFQFDSQVGSQTVKLLQPRSPREMANCNSVMRLMAAEKGGETPTERYKRMKDNMSQWYDEMRRWAISSSDQKILETYYLGTYATPAQQEDMMMILMDPDICNFSLKEANDARKICAKKQMNRIEELHELVLSKATSRQLGEYVWETAIKPQMGYSFSLIHSLAYSFVGLQTIYLATYFDPVYWNTACLRVDAGLDEDASSNYGKIAKAVGNIIHRGIPMSLIDINKSGYMFEPDVETGSIVYGLKGLNGVGGEIIQEIIENRPYTGLEDFQEKVKVKKPVLISLIKSGAFDKFGNREDIMREYIWSICEPKKRITLQNFNGLMERNLIPAELSFEKRLFVFNKALRKFCRVGDYLLVNDNFYEFYEQFFDVDLLEPFEEGLAIKEPVWKKLYTKGMDKARNYFKAHQDELLRQLNQTLFDEMWDKYAAGTLATWEMDSLGFYYHDHPLANIDKISYNIIPYNQQPDNPIVERTFKRNGVDIPLFKTCRIIGTVVAKEDNKSCISILTPDSGVVTVKMSRDYYARLNRQMSQVQPDGTKKVMEKGWFTRGTLLMINGFKRSGMFFSKAYRHNKSHQVYRITSINQSKLEITSRRWGEEDDDTQ
jgi:DNA polymerase-3 subunit alpha